jgi:glucan 1,3-beta-glucosidase
MIGWSIADVPLESFDAGGWVRNLALAAVALLAPPVLSAAVMRGTPMPAFAQVIGPRANRARDPLALAAGLLLIAVMLLAIQSALGLVFDPRYRDIVFAPLTGTMLPFLVLSLRQPREIGPRAVAETVAAALLAAAAVYIVINESFANWQAVWLGASLIGVAIILVRVRDVPGLE